MKDNISFTDIYKNDVTVARIHFVSIETVMSAGKTIMDYVVRTTVKEYSIDKYEYERLIGK